MTPPARRHVVVAAVALIAVVPLAVLARIRWQPLGHLDRRIDLRAHSAVSAHRWLLRDARALTHLGDPAVVTVAAVVLAVLAWRLGRRRTAAYLLVVRLAAVALAWVLKESVRRARPVLAHPVAHASGFSFPSGHAMGSAALYASVAVAAGVGVPLWARAAVATLPPVVVATTRVLLGVHFPSDVVAGLVVGWATALLATAVLPPAAAAGCPRVAATRR